MIYTKHCSIKKDYLGKIVLDKNMLNAVTYVSEENKIYYRRNKPIDYFDVFDYRIEYIENFDTCYIDTGIKGSGSQRVECEFMPIQKTTGWNCVYGARTAPGTKDDGIYIYSNASSSNTARQYIGYNTTYITSITSTINLNTRYTIVQDKGTFILDGTVVKTYTDATFTCPTATIFIFDGNNNGTRGNYNGYFRLYSFKIWNNDVLVRDYIPVVKDNIAYLYDKVSGQLFGNASGSSSFGKGPILEEDKNRLVRIQYLESNGTQCIDTGVTTLNTFAGIDTYISFPTYTHDKWGAGYSNYSGGARSGFQIGMYNNNIEMSLYNVDTTVVYIKLIDYDSNTHHCIINCLDVGLELDEVVYQSNQITDLGNKGGNICLFARGGNINANYRPNCRIESAKIYLDNNRLVRDFIPVRLKNRGYMFDRITGILYGGVGDFILGPDIENEDTYDVELKYLESTGTQYINLDYIGKGSDIIETKVRCTQLTGTFSSSGDYPLYMPIFGIVNSDSHKYWAAYVISAASNKHQLFYYNTYNNGNLFASYTPVLNSTTILQWYNFIWNKTLFTSNGNALSTTVTQNGVSVSPDLIQSMFLFYVNGTNFYTASSLSGNTSWLQIANFIIKDELGNKKRDLIPVMKNGVGYMYDKISKRLFENVGTESFLMGPPSNYQEIEYLESTGTQYIDTGIISQNNLIYDFYLEETQVNNQKTFFGFKEGTSWTVPGMNNANWGNSYGIYVDFANNGSSQISSFKYPNRNGTYYFDFTDGNAKFLFNNVSKWTSTLTGTYDGSRHIFIFAMDFPVSSNSTRYGIGRIKYFKIIKNNILLFDGIPVREGNIGYLYDKVTGQLFGNAGTGDFVLGPDV